MPPNISRDNDKPVLLADGRTVPAHDFFTTLGGLGGLRLMAEPGSEKPRVTRSRSRLHGEVWCLAFPSARDGEGRITYGAIVFPRDMLQGDVLWEWLRACDIESRAPGAADALGWLKERPPTAHFPRRSKKKIRRLRLAAALLLLIGTALLVL